MSDQMMLFEVAQERRDDGSFVVTPKTVVDDREISVRETMRRLGYKCPKPVYRLIDAGLLTAWKNETPNGNAKFRVALSSVLYYKARRSAAARGEEG